MIRAAFLCALLATPPAGAVVTPASSPRFEENSGQLEQGVRFVRRSAASSLFLLDRSAVLAWDGGRVDLEFPGSSPGPAVGREQEPGLSHHFIGSDPARWVKDVRSFQRVVYPAIYPGIDLVFRSDSRGRVEFDFVVAPGGRPEDLRLRVAGGGAAIEVSGDLVIGSAAGEVRIGRPAVYQDSAGSLQAVEGRFVRLGRGLFGFRVGRYDEARPLVIDPVLTYSTYFGGSSLDDGYALAVGPTGTIYVAGTTYSANLPVANAFQPVNNSPSQRDAFVSAFDPTGRRLIFSTFLGGQGGYEIAHALAVDAGGNVYVAGETYSLDFPVTPGAFQTEVNPWAGTDGFVTKIAPDGRSLVFSTILASNSPVPSFESVAAIAVGPDSSVTVGGDTSTSYWPVTPGAFRTTGCGGFSDGFIARLKPDGSGLVFSTYLCGNGPDTVEALRVLPDGRTVAAGTTGSTDFPLAPASGGPLGGAADGYVARLDATGSRLELSRFLGGTGSDQAHAIAVGGSGDVWVAGQTSSTDFPVRDAYQPHLVGGSCSGGPCPDAFLARLSSSGEVLMATYLGGTGEDIARSVDVSLRGAVAIAGTTTSGFFPTVDPIQGTYGKLRDAFAAAFRSDGRILFSTYLGGTEHDEAFASAFSPDGSLVVAGVTGSADFPTRSPYQALLANPSPLGTSDVFLSRIAFEDAETFVPIVLSSVGKNGSFFTSELAFANRGATPLTLALSYTPAPGMGGVAGSGTDTLGPGRQRIVPDAVTYLKEIGLAIEPSGNRGGTLRVRTPGVADPSAVAITARTTTPAANGRAGLAYTGVLPVERLTGAAFLTGLRQNEGDRSNVALQNLGGPADGDVTLRVTVVSGDPSAPLSHALSDQTIPPGGFLQVSEVLRADGLSVAQGFVRVERVSGTAPYYAYGVVNDQANSDGSFIAPVTEQEVRGLTGLTVPVIVETSTFTSELVLTNTSGETRHLRALWVADGLTTADHTAVYDLDLYPREQRIIPDFAQTLRAAGTAGVPPRGGNLAGALFVTALGELDGVTIGARTSAPGGGGRFGLFYAAVPYGRSSGDSAWLFGLRQDGENRTNLALVNTGELGGESDTFRIDLFDGATGNLVASTGSIVVPARGFEQINSVLYAYAPGVLQGYARVVRTAGSNPYVVYAVVNDGASPGARTGDGAFVVSRQD